MTCRSPLIITLFKSKPTETRSTAQELSNDVLNSIVRRRENSRPDLMNQTDRTPQLNVNVLCCIVLNPIRTYCHKHTHALLQRLFDLIVCRIYHYIGAADFSAFISM